MAIKVAAAQVPEQKPRIITYGQLGLPELESGPNIPLHSIGFRRDTSGPYPWILGHVECATINPKTARPTIFCPVFTTMSQRDPITGRRPPAKIFHSHSYCCRCLRRAPGKLHNLLRMITAHRLQTGDELPMEERLEKMRKLIPLVAFPSPTPEIYTQYMPKQDLELPGLKARVNHFAAYMSCK